MPTPGNAPRAPAGASLKDRLVGGGAWAIAGKIGIGVTQLAALAWVAHLLPPHSTAVFLLAQSIVGLGAIVGRLGLELTAVRLVSQALGRGDEGAARASAVAIVRAGTGGALAAGAVLALGGAAWAGRSLLAAPRLADVAPALAVWAVGLALQMLLAEIFRGLHAIREAMTWGGLASNLLVLVGLFSLSQSGAATLGATIWICAASVVLSMVAAGAVLAVRLNRLAPPTFPALETCPLLATALPLLVSNLMGFALLRADLWIVSAFSSADDVAAYGAASRLVILIGLPLTVANQVVAPLIGDLHSRGDARGLGELVRGVAGAVAVPATLLGGAFILFGAPLLSLVYGAFFARAWPILALLSVAQLSMVLTGSCGLALVMTGHQRTYMGIMVAAAVALLTAGPVAARSHGGVGLAAVACLVLVVQQLVTLLFAKRLTGHWTYASLLHLRRGAAALLARAGLRV